MSSEIHWSISSVALSSGTRFALMTPCRFDIVHESTSRRSKRHRSGDARAEGVINSCSDCETNDAGPLPLMYPLS